MLGVGDPDLRDGRGNPDVPVLVEGAEGLRHGVGDYDGGFVAGLMTVVPIPGGRR